MANRINLDDVKVVTAADIKARRRDEATGRFLADDQAERPSMVPEIGVGLAQALLDADAEAFRTTQAVRTAERLVSAVEFGDRVKNGGWS